MIAAREFRSDLYYRLHVFPIRVPPLRERKEDIPQLVSYFVQKFAKQMQKKIEAISPAVLKGLMAWEWPGNIRELENFIERAVIVTRGRSLDPPLGELRKTNTVAFLHCVRCNSSNSINSSIDCAGIERPQERHLDSRKNISFRTIGILDIFDVFDSSCAALPEKLPSIAVT
ncbi:MAG: AAA-type ATPase lid domain-containing protein [Candidatus Sulfotelmatobacter sp.]|jgi:transcriptional regulator with GAF, ATPase, and Fis domain